MTKEKSKGPTLWDMTAEYREAMERMSDLNLPDEVIRDTLEGLAGGIEDKCTNALKVAQHFEALAVAVGENRKRLSAREKALENKAHRIKEYIRSCMTQADLRKIETSEFVINRRAGKEAVVVDDPTLIPAVYWKFPEPPPPTLDKNEIYKAIKTGDKSAVTSEAVPGVHLEPSEYLEVK